MIAETAASAVAYRTPLQSEARELSPQHRSNGEGGADGRNICWDDRQAVPPRRSGGCVRVAEFFAGMGLMRAGLEKAGARTVFANDIDPTKAKLYRANWGEDVLGSVDVLC